MNMAGITSVHAHIAVSIHFIYGDFILFVGLLMFAVVHYLGCVAGEKKKIGVSGFPDNKQPSLQGLVESNVSWELMAKPPPSLSSSCRILPSLSGFKSTAGQAALGKKDNANKFIAEHSIRRVTKAS